jgi:hypothetical protein
VLTGGTRAIGIGLVVAAEACLPTDEAVGMGSAQFSVRTSSYVDEGFITSDSTSDGVHWKVRFEKVRVAFETMTLQNTTTGEGVYIRGSGEPNNVVFDPNVGLLQTLNGLEPARYVIALRLAPPTGAFGVGPGTTSADLFELAAQEGIHTLVDVRGSHDAEALAIRLRFDARTGTSFSLDERILRPNERAAVGVELGLEQLFFDGREHRIRPFIEADRAGNGDGIVTMAEVDALALDIVRDADAPFTMPPGTVGGSFGDYLRMRFDATIRIPDRAGE